MAKVWFANACMLLCAADEVAARPQATASPSPILIDAPRARIALLRPGNCGSICSMKSRLSKLAARNAQTATVPTADHPSRIDSASAIIADRIFCPRHYYLVGSKQILTDLQRDARNDFCNYFVLFVGHRIATAQHELTGNAVGLSFRIPLGS